MLSNKVYYTKQEYKKGGSSIGVVAIDQGEEKSNCSICLKTQAV